MFSSGFAGGLIRPALRRWVSVVVSGALAVSVLSVVAPAVVPVVAPAVAATASSGGDFVAVAPTQKIVDTSTGVGISATLGAASTTAFQVLGQGGVPSSGVGAVSVDLEATGSSAGGYLTLWADGTTKPSTTTMNLTTGLTSDNAAILAVGSDGKVDVYNLAGTVNLRVVVNGYYTTATGTAAPGGYVPITPTRLVDTRVGTGAALAQIPAGGSIDVQVDGVAGITGESSVFANLTVPAATAGGSLYGYASGASSGGQPILTFSTTTRSAGAIIAVGSNGKITLRNSSTTAAIDVVVDVPGFFSTASSTGGGFTATSARLLDTRTTTALAAYGTVNLQIGGSNGVPARFGAAAVDLVAISGANTGYLHAWATGSTMPTTSVDSYQANGVTSSMAVVAPNATGSISVYNASSGSIQLVVDLQGWFAYNSPPTTPTALAAAPTATAGYTSSVTPTLSGTATDADSSTVRLDYQILSGSTVAASGSSAFVSSGTSAPWADTTTLAQGAYTWKVRSFDGSQYSAWSAAQPLTVDSWAPSDSSVASTDFPANTWSGTPDASGNFTGSFTATPPSSEVAGIGLQLDGGAWTKVATTGTAVSQSFTFAAGKHTVVAKTYDTAGNWAGGTSYVFYAGSGAALTAPGAGERPARRVGLMALGLTSYTGVTYQYRIGDTDTWHSVPVANVTQNSDGSTLSSWPVAVTNGLPAALTWNITDTFAVDGPVDVRALFTDGTTTGASPANTVTVDRNAGTAPSVSAGPASVNSLTGDASLSATDASAFGMTVTRSSSSRRPGNGAAQAGQAAIFGPQWTAGTTAETTDSDWSYITQTSTMAVSLVDVDGDPTGFTATSSGAWKPEPGSEDLTLTGSLTGSFTLKDTDSTTTVFTKPSGASTWQVTSTYLATANSTTTVVPQTVTVNGTTLVEPHYVIAPTSAVAAATCQTTPSTAGCRMLEYVYATATTATTSTPGDFTGQVKQIKLWATAPGATSATATVIGQYDYDTAGQLLDQWDPRVSPALKTSYSYDSAGRVTTQTDPGQLPWTFAYGKVGTNSTSGDGMLLSASRPTLTPGSNTTTNGTATTTVVYNVPLSGSSAPNAMSTTDTATWAQTDAPTDATAVFPADQVPASNDGSTLGSGDYGRATLTYLDASGRQVNTATPVGHITTTQYDRYGNTVFQLTAANRELALGTAAWQVAQRQSLDIEKDTTVQRAQLLSTTSLYNTTSVVADTGTDKNTDPSVIGQRNIEEYGPIHLVTLAHNTTTAGGTIAAGTQVPSRQHTLNTFDQGRPTDGTATTSNQITTAQVGAVVDGAADGDTTTTKTTYDWVKGLATATTTDPNGLALTTTTGYDSQGRVISTSLPKSTGSDAGTTITTYWSATGTGTCQGRPEWADLVCSTAPAGAITGGGTNPTGLKTTTTTYDQWGNTATVTDTANGVTRTTTNTYDAAGRLTKTAVTGGSGTAVADTTTAYDPATGNKASVTANGQTITYTYDALGRQTQYADGNGATTSTSYDALDRPVTVTNNTGTTTNTYDTSKNAAGLMTSMTDPVAGTISAQYDSDGNLYAEQLPGSVTLQVSRDQTGAVTARTYTRSDGTVITSDTATFTIAGQEATHSSTAPGIGAEQAYTYDAAGRLTQADDTEGSTTTHRAYTFDNNTNRTGLTTTVDNADGSAGTPATTAYTYDSGDRLQTVAGTGVVYDAFGRTTTQADGTTLAYYTNDLAQRETSGTTRQTWTLDAAGRQASWSTESNSTGTWTQSGSHTNHYGSDGDSPDWTVDNTAGTISRNVQGIDGDLAATTDATGNTVLQLTNIHGDATVQYPLDTTKSPVVQAYDEFGNPINGTTATTYGWLGAKQKSSNTPSGLTLMGVRLYNPTTGRFLQIDPVPGGSSNAYEYGGGDPITHFDLDGQSWRIHWNYTVLGRYALELIGRSGGSANRSFASGLGFGLRRIAPLFGYKCGHSYGMRTCVGGSFLNARGGTTLGNTYFTGSRRYVTPARIRHEMVHVRQWRTYGPIFPILYGLAGSNPCTNRWERQAGWRNGGYSQC
ncbi:MULTISPECIES: RHS repeat-associated core domain-containing protein [Streptacidiphilus]|uniref:RHS repeat-associated core domain-containing protein n=1 Tax=Streptacidiphilus cavernicola TaxID=3342716 RepID=A0ABV6UMZ2_9ACTN|nr:RHS repeat-associated core domain-containing protein [Streptacidiphilus jeojiense]